MHVGSGTGQTAKRSDITTSRFSQTSETTVSHHPAPSRSASLFSNGVGGPWTQHAQVRRQTLNSPAAERSDGAVQRVGVHVHGYSFWEVLKEDTQQRNTWDWLHLPTERSVTRLPSVMTEDGRARRHTCTRRTSCCVAHSPLEECRIHSLIWNLKLLL